MSEGQGGVDWGKRSGLITLNVVIHNCFEERIWLSVDLEHHGDGNFGSSERGELLGAENLLKAI